MLVGLEVGRQVAAAALLAVSSIAPNPGLTPTTDDSPALCATASAAGDCRTATPSETPSASPGSSTAGSGSGVAAPSLTGSPCDTTPTTGAAPTAGSTGASDVTTGTEDASDTAARRYPAQLLPLDSWKLTLPTGEEGGPQEIEQPELATYSSEYFQLDRTGTGVAFRATVGGVTTENSSYPRSELREMNGTERAAWSSTSGTHTLELCQAITETPVAKPHVVSAQIHDGNDDVLQIRLEGRRLMVQYDDGGKSADLDPAYQLGTPFRVRIVAAADGVQVFYNGQQKAELPLSGTGWYWKAGAYVQSNTSKGDGPDAAGEVVIYALRLDHGGGSAGTGTGSAAGAGAAGGDSSDDDPSAGDEPAGDAGDGGSDDADAGDDDSTGDRTGDDRTGDDDTGDDDSGDSDEGGDA